MRDPERVLDVLQEECAEVIQAISKIKRFGLHDIYPMPDGKSNVDKLAEELGHVKCMIIEAQDHFSELTEEKILKAMHQKTKKLDYWLPHEGEAGYIPNNGGNDVTSK